MSKISDAKTILEALGLPPAQFNEMSCLTLLALAGIKPDGSWKDARRSRTSVSKGVMAFVRENYAKDYAENTRACQRFIPVDAQDWQGSHLRRTSGKVCACRTKAYRMYLFSGSHTGRIRFKVATT